MKKPIMYALAAALALSLPLGMSAADAATTQHRLHDKQPANHHHHHHHHHYHHHHHTGTTKNQHRLHDKAKAA